MNSKLIALLGGAFAIGGLLIAAAPQARADIMFAIGNNPGPNEENILFGASETGKSVTGTTDSSGVSVTFSTLTNQTLTQTAKGQADIMCSAGCIDGGTNNTSSQLNSLEIKLASGFGATDFIGNLDFGEGTATVAVTDQMGAVFSYTLGNGQNFFTLTAINNEVITDIQITKATTSTDPFGWNDFKQPRISGVCTLVGTTCTQIPVPEPTSLALLGAGLVGIGFLGRRRLRM